MPPNADPNPLRPCPVCGAIAPTAVYRQRFAGMSDSVMLTGYTVSTCAGCGAGYADDLPDQAVFDDYYREMSKYEGPPPAPASGRVADTYQRLTDTISPYLLGPTDTILDIGAGTGSLLGCFRRAGYENGLGYEPSPTAAAVAGRAHGVRVLSTPLDRLIADHPPFQLVTLTGVLEHVRDLGPLLALVRSALAPNGLVFASVPDATRFDEFPGAPFQEFSVEHINFFSPDSLTRLFATAGFRPVFARREWAALSETTNEADVWGLFRITAEGPAPAPGFDAETGPALRSYVESSGARDAEVHRRIRAVAASGRPVYVWGTGTHTLRLLEAGPLAEVNVLGYVDSNPRYAGRAIRGVPVFGPAALAGRPEPIIVSSWVHQSAITRMIREELRLPNEILVLYDL